MLTAIRKNKWGESMDYLNLTEKYYSKWLGQDDILLHCQEGVYDLYSSERDKIQKGYSRPFDLYLLIRENSFIISYGKKAAFGIKAFKQSLNSTMSADEVMACIEQVYGMKPAHQIKYVYQGDPVSSQYAEVLTAASAKSYLSFFKNCNPDCSDTSWVEDYFMDMICQHACCGVFVDHQLVSCTDSPDVPYMASQVQEIGINTLPAYRQQGYALDACRLCIKEIIHFGKCPLWSASSGNTASRILAEKAGFVKYADCLALTL